MMKITGLSILCVCFLWGCSDFENPKKGLTVESIVGGGASLKTGMSKDEVLEKWGRPDDKKVMGETRWGAPIEKWTYHAWFPSVPVDYRYVSKGRHLYFEGDALARWEDIEIKGEDEASASAGSQKSDSTQTQEAGTVKNQN